VIYASVKGGLLYLLQAPAHPPEPPAGSPGSVEVFRASKQFLFYKLTLLAIFFAVLLLLLSLLTLAVFLDAQAPRAAKIVVTLVTLGVVGLGLFCSFLTRLEYDMRYYLVTDRSLRIRQGVWTITEVTLTYANVQHLEIRQGPIQQMLGIADLIVRTAGGSGGAAVGQQQMGQTSGHRGALRGIDNAEAICDRINHLLKQYRHAGLGDPEEKRSAPRAARGWNPLVIERLKEIRDEIRAWRGM
jgi:membrane protein YdbS with pleckstrin-like domain